MQQSLENSACAILTISIGYSIVRILIFKLEDSSEKHIRIPRIMMTHILNAIRWFLYLMVVLLALAFLDEDIDAVILSVSALAAFIPGFGPQDTMNNLASGVRIASARAYDIEDEVTIAGHRGYGKNGNSDHIPELAGRRGHRRPGTIVASETEAVSWRAASRAGEFPLGGSATMTLSVRPLQ